MIYLAAGQLGGHEKLSWMAISRDSTSRVDEGSYLLFGVCCANIVESVFLDLYSLVKW